MDEPATSTHGFAAGGGSRSKTSGSTTGWGGRHTTSGDGWGGWRPPVEGRMDEPATSTALRASTTSGEGKAEEEAVAAAAATAAACAASVLESAPSVVNGEASPEDAAEPTTAIMTPAVVPTMSEARVGNQLPVLQFPPTSDRIGQTEDGDKEREQENEEGQEKERETEMERERERERETEKGTEKAMQKAMEKEQKKEKKRETETETAAETGIKRKREEEYEHEHEQEQEQEQEQEGEKEMEKGKERREGTVAEAGIVVSTEDGECREEGLPAMAQDAEHDHRPYTWYAEHDDKPPATGINDPRGGIIADPTLRATAPAQVTTPTVESDASPGREKGEADDASGETRPRLVEATVGLGECLVDDDGAQAKIEGEPIGDTLAETAREIETSMRTARDEPMPPPVSTAEEAVVGSGSPVVANRGEENGAAGVMLPAASGDVAIKPKQVGRDENSPDLLAPYNVSLDRPTRESLILFSSPPDIC